MIPTTSADPYHAMFKIYNLSGQYVINKLSRNLVPPLVSTAHKGQMGRIAVVGGSPDYTGAPYYAAESALKFGADLSFVFCAKQAAIPIKSYSPELMVTPFYDMDALAPSSESSPRLNDHLGEEETCSNQSNNKEKQRQATIDDMVSKVVNFFPRLHALVIGPGLGRDPSVLKATTSIIERARLNDLPLVIDADALWLVSQNLSVVRGYKSCILTPNGVEFERLVAAAVEAVKGRTSKGDVDVGRVNNEDCGSTPDANTDDNKGGSSNSGSSDGESGNNNNNNDNHNNNDNINRLVLHSLQSTNIDHRLRALCQELDGVTVLRKGSSDALSSGGDVFLLQEVGSPRRCGGQGDILAGSLGVAVYWSKLRASSLSTAAIEEALANEDLCPVTVVGESPSPSTASLPSGLSDTIKGPVGDGVTISDASTASSQSHSSSASRNNHQLLWGAALASVVTKRASALAFAKYKRSMTSPNVLAHVGEAFERTVEM